MVKFDSAEEASNNAKYWTQNQNPDIQHRAFLYDHNGQREILTNSNEDGLTLLADAVSILDSLWGFVRYDGDDDRFVWTNLENHRNEQEPHLISLDSAFESISTNKRPVRLLKKKSGITILTLHKSDIRPGDAFLIAIKTPMYEMFMGLIHEMAESASNKLLAGINPSVIVRHKVNNEPI